MKNKRQGKVIIEEFTIPEIKEYLTTFIQVSANASKLLAIANIVAYPGKAKFVAKTNQIVFETNEKDV